MANQYSNVSLQSANQIVFKHSVTTDSPSEFTNGITDILMPFDDEVENTFNVEGKGLKLVCYSKMLWYATTGTAALLTTARAGNATTTILLDDNTVVLGHSWNQKTVIELNNIPFSTVTIKTRCMVEGAKSVYRDSGTLTDGSSASQVSMILSIK